MDRRERRLVLLGWWVLGVVLGLQGSIGVRTWDQWKPSSWKRETAPAEVRNRPGLTTKQLAQESFTRCEDLIRVGGDVSTWRVAEASCRAAVAANLRPNEAGTLLSTAVREGDCAESLSRANNLMLQRHHEEVFAALRWYDPSCRGADEARIMLLDAMGEVERPAAEDCLEAATQEDWAGAATSCALAMDVACWRLPEAQLEVPAGKKLSLWGKLPKNGWRPNDQVYLALLRAQAKEEALQPWSCRPRSTLLDRRDWDFAELANVRPSLRARFKDPHLALALERYHVGKLAEAEAGLKQSFAHAGLAMNERVLVGELLGEVSNARHGYRQGLDKLTDGDLEGAANVFRLTLKLDEKLVGAENGSSWLRASIVESMQRRALHAGRFRNHKDGCAAWKVGLSFGPSDLLTSARRERKCAD